MTIFYSSGKKLFTMDKTDLAVYHENGKEVFSNSAEGIKINGEPAKKSLLDMFSKENLVKTALYLLTSDTIQAEYKSGKPSIQLKGTTAVMYYPSGKIYMKRNYNKTYEITYYYENGQIFLSGYVKNNTAYGEWKYYDKKGKLVTKGEYNQISKTFETVFGENLKKTLKTN